MAQAITLASGTLAAALTTELNSLANNGLAISPELTVAPQNYLEAEIEYLGAHAVAPTANTCMTLWILRALDGANYEDGSATVTPLRSPDAFFPLRAVTTAQRIVKRVLLPPGLFKILLKNDATGQALAAASNTLKIKPLTPQVG